MTLTAKVAVENRIMIEGIRTSLWPYEVSVSAIVDALLTCIRLKVAAGTMELNPPYLQALLRNDRLVPSGASPALIHTHTSEKERVA